jgi:hypothetical protein
VSNVDPLVQKAWELYQHTAHFPVETILHAHGLARRITPRDFRRQRRDSDSAALFDSGAADKKLFLVNFTKNTGSI